MQRREFSGVVIMNKQRRKIISECTTQIEEIKLKLEDVKSDEEFAFDSMPENLQGSERGEEMEEAIDCLEEAIDSLDSVIEQLNELN